MCEIALIELKNITKCNVNLLLLINPNDLYQPKVRFLWHNSINSMKFLLFIIGILINYVTITLCKNM